MRNPGVGNPYSLRFAKQNPLVLANQTAAF